MQPGRCLQLRELNITRRRFAELLAGLIALLFTSGLVAGVLKYLRPPTLTKNAAAEELEVASVDELQVGDTKMFKFGDKAAILLRRPAGFRAYGAVCTHLGCIVDKEISEMGMIYCPCHAGMYDPETGEVLAGPPPSRLPSILLKRENGKIYALAWKDPEYVKSLPMYQ